MNISTYFRSQAYNNAWANYRLLTACAELPAEELNALRTNFFPSIIVTLNHILVVDWFYVNGLDGTGYDGFDPDQKIPCPEFEDLNREQRLVDRRLIAFCEDLDTEALAATVHLPRKGWVQAETAERVLLHLFQHQIHHRGQIHAMLAGTDVKPPQLDEFFLGHEDEITLRAPDFAVLGFDEEKIWF